MDSRKSRGNWVLGNLVKCVVVTANKAWDGDDKRKTKRSSRSYEISYAVVVVVVVVKIKIKVGGDETRSSDRGIPGF